MKRTIERAIIGAGSIAGGAYAHWLSEWPNKITMGFLLSALLIYGWYVLLGAALPALIIKGATERQPRQIPPR